MNFPSTSREQALPALSHFTKVSLTANKKAIVHDCFFLMAWRAGHTQFCCTAAMVRLQKLQLEKAGMFVLNSGQSGEIRMAYTFLSRFRIKPAHEAAFVALAQQMEGLVHLEPGTLGFKFFRLEEPGMFAVYESFIDEAADKAHMETAHGKPIIEKMLGCMDGSYSRELLLDL